MKARVAVIQHEAIAAYFSLGDFVNHILATFYAWNLITEKLEASNVWDSHGNDGMNGKIGF